MCGMFDKDRYFRYPIMDRALRENVPFVIHGVEVREGFPLPNDQGTTDQAILTVAFLEAPDRAFQVSTISGPITRNARTAEDKDFPQLVVWKEVSASEESWNDAKVLQLAPVPDAELERVHALPKPDEVSTIPAGDFAAKGDDTRAQADAEPETAKAAKSKG